MPGKVDIVEVERLFSSAKRLAIESGMDEERARECSADFVLRETGVDIYRLLGISKAACCGGVKREKDLPSLGPTGELDFIPPSAPAPAPEVDMEKVLLQIYRENSDRFLLRTRGKYLLEDHVMGVYDSNKEVLFFYIDKLYRELERRGINPRKLKQLKQENKLWLYRSESDRYSYKLNLCGKKRSSIGLKVRGRRVRHPRR
jgi:hypothetical protein